jgi:L-aspartate oxidase
LRGEGAVLKIRDRSGRLVEFAHNYHKMGSLAPRDIVARAIDSELKRSGQPCVYLDMRGKDEEFLRKRFPHIFEKCLEAGFNLAKDPIPAVPAAHFSCAAA